MEAPTTGAKKEAPGAASRPEGLSFVGRSFAVFGSYPTSGLPCGSPSIRQLTQLPF